MNLRVATALTPSLFALLLSVVSALTGCTTPDPEGRLGEFDEARAAAALADAKSAAEEAERAKVIEAAVEARLAASMAS